MRLNAGGKYLVAQIGHRAALPTNRSTVFFGPVFVKTMSARERVCRRFSEISSPGLSWCLGHLRFVGTRILRPFTAGSFGLTDFRDERLSREGLNGTEPFWGSLIRDLEGSELADSRTALKARWISVARLVIGLLGASAKSTSCRDCDPAITLPSSFTRRSRAAQSS